MHTLILPGRSHVISDEMAARLIAALNERRPVESVAVEMNGEGTGEWEVFVNVNQIIALVKHPNAALDGVRHLRVASTN